MLKEITTTRYIPRPEGYIARPLTLRSIIWQFTPPAGGGGGVHPAIRDAANTAAAELTELLGEGLEPCEYSFVPDVVDNDGNLDQGFPKLLATEMGKTASKYAMLEDGKTVGSSPCEIAEFILFPTYRGDPLVGTGDREKSYALAAIFGPKRDHLVRRARL